MLKFKKGEDAFDYQNKENVVLLLVSKSTYYDKFLFFISNPRPIGRNYFLDARKYKSKRDAIRQMKKGYNIIDRFETDVDWKAHEGFIGKPKV